MRSDTRTRSPIKGQLSIGRGRCGHAIARKHASIFERMLLSQVSKEIVIGSKAEIIFPDMSPTKTTGDCAKNLTVVLERVFGSFVSAV